MYKSGMILENGAGYIPWRLITPIPTERTRDVWIVEDVTDGYRSTRSIPELLAIGYRIDRSTTQKITRNLPDWF